jgi:hypothetical protein
MASLYFPTYQRGRLGVEGGRKAAVATKQRKNLEIWSRQKIAVYSSTIDITDI